jgi:methylmalonyl-CoA mutase cobalamin-binding subunit
MQPNRSLQKSVRKDRAAAIQQRATAVLLSIPKEAFADSFQKLYERCQLCVVKDDDYFEGQ